ncbi:hypothetical protein GCM10029963_54440 [Micromonospora andamanensis]
MGADDATVATVDVFDPAAGTWSTLPGVTNPAPVAAAGAAVVGGKVYLVGGCADATCTDSDGLVVFDAATGTFSTGAAYPHPVSWLACGGIGASVYCAGGTGSTEYTDAYRYDPRQTVGVRCRGCRWSCGVRSTRRPVGCWCWPAG